MRLFAHLALAAILGVNAAAAETPGAGVVDEIGAAPQEPAVGKAFARRSQPCGSRANGFFCARLVPDNTDPARLEPYRVVYPGPGTAVITWQGVTLCDIAPLARGPDGTEVEYYLHFTLNGAANFAYNEPGSVSLGEYLGNSSRDSAVKRNPVTPVTVSDVVKIRRAGAVSHRLTIFPDFRKYALLAIGSFCNVNGGAYTVQYTPD